MAKPRVHGLTWRLTEGASLLRVTSREIKSASKMLRTRQTSGISVLVPRAESSEKTAHSCRDRATRVETVR